MLTIQPYPQKGTIRNSTDEEMAAPGIIMDDSESGHSYPAYAFFVPIGESERDAKGSTDEEDNTSYTASVSRRFHRS
jgi:hypothetical protein